MATSGTILAGQSAILASRGDAKIYAGDTPGFANSNMICDLSALGAPGGPICYDQLGRKIYFCGYAANTSVWSYSLLTGQTSVVASGLGYPAAAIDTAGGKLYVAEHTLGQILLYDLHSPALPPQILVSGLVLPWTPFLDLSNGHIYVPQDTSVTRYSLSGTAPVAIMTGLSYPSPAIADLDGRLLYCVTEYFKIRRCSLDNPPNSGAANIFGDSGAGSIPSIAYNDGSIYFGTSINLRGSGYMFRMTAPAGPGAVGIWNPGTGVYGIHLFEQQTFTASGAATCFIQGMLFGNPTIYTLGYTDCKVRTGDFPNFANSGELCDLSPYIRKGGDIVVHRPGNRIFVSEHFGDYDNKIVSYLPGTDDAHIIASGLMLPCIAVDHVNEKLYFTDYVTSGTISRCDFDGGSRQVLASGIDHPFCMVLDVPSGHIYVAHFLEEVVRRYDLDGANPVVIVSGVGVWGVALDAINRRIFVTDDTNNKVVGADIDSFPDVGRTDLLSLAATTLRMTHYASGYLFFTTQTLISSGYLFSIRPDGTEYTMLANPDTSLRGVYFASDRLATKVGDLNLATNGMLAMIAETTLFIEGGSFAPVSGLCDLVIAGSLLVASSISGYINGYGESFGDIGLYAIGDIAIDWWTTLFLPCYGTVYSSLMLSVSGIPGTGVASVDLAIFGEDVPIDATCPVRSPLVAFQVTDALVDIYQANIDALINQLGQYVTLEFEGKRTECPNCLPDTLRKRSSGRYRAGGPVPFADGGQCPYCQKAGFITEDCTKCIQCLVKWSLDDAETYKLGIRDPQGLVRLKTYATTAPDLMRCKTALIPNAQMPLRVKLVRGPIPVGLRDKRYCISFWRIVS